MSEPAAGVGVVFAAPVLLAVGAVAVVAAGAVVVVGGVGYAGAQACFGVARMTGDIIQGINERADKDVSEEVARVVANMPNYLIKLEKHEVEQPVPLTELSSIFAQYEQVELDRVEKVVAAFSELIELREGYEHQKSLKADISGQLKNQLADLEKQKKAAEEKLKQKKAETDRLLAVGRSLEEEQYFAKFAFIKKILHDFLELHFKKTADLVRSELDALQHDEININKLKNIILKYQLDKKYDADQQEQLKQTLTLRLLYEADLFTRQLAKREQDEFYTALSAANEAISFGKFNTTLITTLERILEGHRQKGLVIDKAQRFAVSKTNSLKSLQDTGYGTVQSIDSDQVEFILEATALDGKRARIFIRKPDAPEGPALRVIVDQEPYDNQQSYCKEAKRITSRLEELGIVVDWHETITHFKGKLVANGIEILKKELEGTGVDVSMVDDTNNILVNGQPIEWRAGISIKDMLSKVNTMQCGETSSEQAARQDNRMKETN